MAGRSSVFRAAPAAPLVLSAALFTCAAAAQEPAPLSQDEMQQVLRALRADFSAPEAVSYESLNRAAIDGLLKANPRTMQLVKEEAAPAPAPKFLTAAFAENLAAVRPAGFSAGDLKSLRDSVTKFASEMKAATLILDLRTPCADADPAAAAELLSLFLPGDTPFFTCEKPFPATNSVAWPGDLIVLVDEESCNAGEIAAAVLKSRKRAWVIGSQTRGRLAVVKELPLRDRLKLRYTARPVEIAGAADLFGKGLIPDQTSAFEAERKKAAFSLQQSEGLARAVFQQPRPRQNEAALLSRENVEIQDRIARSSGRLSPYDTAPADRAMQLAVDVVTARRILGH